MRRTHWNDNRLLQPLGPDELYVGKVLVLVMMIFYICTKFLETILNGIKVIERTRFSLEKKTLRHNSAKILGKVTISLVFIHRLMKVYICTKYYENILVDFKLIKRARFSYEKFQRGIIPQKM